MGKEETLPRYMAYNYNERGMEVVIQGNGYFRVQSYNQRYNLLYILRDIFDKTPNQSYEEFRKLGFRCRFEGAYDCFYCDSLEEALKIKAWFDSIEVMKRLKEAK